jgi:hypothetical protein
LIESLQSQVFADTVVSQSKGVVSSFRLVKINPPKSQGGFYVVEISANVAKFKVPNDTGKIKLVVLPLKTTQPSFTIGGVQMLASEALGPIRQQIIDSLTQSGRFIVLDRQFSTDIDTELGLIAKGKTDQNDLAKLSQALSADLIWVGTINSLSYEKNVRKLRTSDRDLVSYAGGWSISQRLLNLTTRQLVLSETFKGEFPTILPSTLGPSVNENLSMANVQSEISKKVIDSIMLKTFPISIISLDEKSVVLSQGEGALIEGQRYRVVKLGKQQKDPQTGQSLGNIELDCCDVVINRVTAKLSYGQLENIKGKLEGLDAGTLQIRERLQVKQTLSHASAILEEPMQTKKSNPKIINQAPKQIGEPKDKDW